MVFVNAVYFTMFPRTVLLFSVVISENVLLLLLMCIGVSVCFSNARTTHLAPEIGVDCCDGAFFLYAGALENIVPGSCREMLALSGLVELAQVMLIVPLGYLIASTIGVLLPHAVAFLPRWLGPFCPTNWAYCASKGPHCPSDRSRHKLLCTSLVAWR